MTNTRLSMRRIKKVLQLHFEESWAKWQIAQSIGVSPTTVGDYTNPYLTLHLLYLATGRGATGCVCTTTNPRRATRDKENWSYDSECRE